MREARVEIRARASRYDEWDDHSFQLETTKITLSLSKLSVSLLFLEYVLFPWVGISFVEFSNPRFSTYCCFRKRDGFQRIEKNFGVTSGQGIARVVR